MIPSPLNQIGLILSICMKPIIEPYEEAITPHDLMPRAVE